MRLPRYFPALVLLVFVPLSVRADQPFRYKEGKFGKAELKYVNDLPVLVVEGTPEEIGEQTAALAREPLKRLMNFAPDLLKALGREKQLPMLKMVGKSMLPQFPADYLQELEAIVKHSGLERELAVVGNTFADISKAGGCSVLLVEPARSATGQILFGRNLDYQTGGILNEFSLVQVVRPKGKHAFASIGFPGFIGVTSGINDAGLALATLEVYSAKDKSAKFDGKGVPYLLGYRRILEECTSIDEAVKLLESIKRTTMNNLAIADKTSCAIIEITTKSVVVRKPERGLCPCTNHFRTDELCTDKKCRRFDALEKGYESAKLDRTAVAKLLDAANQGEYTLQTMIFEPSALKLHLAIGKCPTSALPLKELDLRTYLTKAEN
ncbi:MAG TPA: C45 family peptidase [Gemmataceae bacterium]|nr:C45 family peptidase [Gemmataceae bacterium]